MNEYRIVKNTFRSGNVMFHIECLSQYGSWLHVTARETIELAREAVQQLTSRVIVSSEVVE